MRPLTTRLAFASVAAVLVVGTLGCGILSKAKTLSDTVSLIAQLSDRLKNAQTATYTAKYNVSGDDVTGNGQVTIAQQPPNSAIVSGGSAFIQTKDFLYLCTTAGGTMSCDKSTIASTDSASSAESTASGLMTPELAIGLLAVAAVAPGVSVSSTNKTIAGQNSLCATVSGLSTAGPSDAPAAKDFTICVTDNGVLASFAGTSTDNKKITMDMISYSGTADPSLFQPPANATIHDLGDLPTALPSIN
jgi:hypothetical protein